ncbi:LOW QUALITY PROTEIN: acyl-coenzyme A synthetase ACSM4, mitochondrial-like [Centruroides vittatus]|uniref:LOW QUALITY PROTEIN: acyl-coenzyme A synthetase ACSM4, mitochondrial-like n=1 Tax=Centruroides vittatus TaxID=120091 RepID=UPI00350EC6B0
MASFFNSLRKVSLHLKSYNFTTSKLFSCGITKLEERWNENKEIPEHFNFFEDAVKYWALKENNLERKGPPAFWYVDKNNNDIKWNFQEIVLQTEKAANVLRSCGLNRNHKIIIILPKIPEWWLIVLASLQLGIVFSPGTIQLRSKDILYRINSIKANCIVADLETSERVDQIVKDCPSLTTKILCTEKNKVKDGWIHFKTEHESSPRLKECVKTKTNDPMIIYFTSGTSGNPKAVQHTYEHAFSICICRRYFVDIQSNALSWNLTIHGWSKTVWVSMFLTWSIGAGNFIYNSLRFDAKECLDILQRYPITNFCAPPTAFKFFLKEYLEKYKFSHLKSCTSGGESLTKDLFTTWKEKTGVMIYEGYAQSETSLLCSDLHCKQKKPGSVGLPPPFLQLDIINEKYEKVEPFQEGEIAVKVQPNYPIGLFKEYLNNPEKTKEVFKNGYYLTGDRGYKDNDGYLWFIGRNDDIISSSGYRIGPFEVESALQEHPAVKECAVVGSPDPLRGEVVKAFIILTEKYNDVDKEELIIQLQDHVKNITSPYKYPRKIEFVEDLPRTISGKVQRFKLRLKETEKNKL